jgi:predicted porin
MKKLLIAAAAMSVVAGAASAQSTATIYGTLDVGYGSFDAKAGAGAKSTQSGLMYNTNDSSRWGIKAEEDIGGGVKAGVTIESWIGSLPRKNFGYESAAAGTGSSNNTYALYGVGNSVDVTRLGDRILAAHITMGAHTIQAGQNSAFVRDVAVAYQADGSNVVGNLIGNDKTMTIRNVAANYTYNAQGLTLGFGITNDVKEQDGKADVKTSTGYQLKARYATGPMSVAAAYSEAKTGTGTSIGNAALSSTTPVQQLPTITGLATSLTKELKTKTTVMAADYDLTVAKLFVEYGKVSVDNTMASAPDADSNDRRAVSFGARVPVGKAWLFAQVSDGKQKDGTAQYDGNWKGYSVGARYELSKRTYAYIVDGHTEYTYNTAGDKLKANQYGLGLVHNF